MAPLLDQSSTYSFSDSAAFAKASQEKVGAGYVYSRWANPTTDAFAAAIAGLEGAPDAEATASGMAAISSVFLALCSSGDRVVLTRQLYGGTFSMSTTLLPRFGIHTTLCDLDDYVAIERALDGAKLLYCETIGNPAVRVADLPRLAALAERAGVPFIVDNTFASPMLCRPLEHGAHVVVHSATKFIGGHHDLIGGVVCADPAIVAKVRALTRELGPTLAPFNAWLALRGLATLHVRVDRACASALSVARALVGHPAIEAVFYPALETSPDRTLADSLLGGRGGGVIAFEVAGGRARAGRFQDSLRLIHPAASLGGVHSLLVHPASVTHTQLGPDELAAAGISEGFCRLSVGMEEPEDLVRDLTQALDTSA